MHEVKFDGWRLQLHKLANEVRLYSKNGYDVTDRFRAIAAAGTTLRCTSAILDGELEAADLKGRADFAALHRPRPSRRTLTLWVFDLLHLDGEDLRSLALEERRQKLTNLMKRTQQPLRLSESFDDPDKLLRAAIELGLEGIVSKRRDCPYHSGPSIDWLKVKNSAWRQANRERFKPFAKER